MNSRYTIATLFLVMTLAAAAFAAIRAASDQPQPVALVICGAAAGALFALVYSLWNHDSWVAPLVQVPSGAVLGAGAAALMVQKVEWSVLIVGPLAVWALALVIRINRQRRPRF